MSFDLPEENPLEIKIKVVGVGGGGGNVVNRMAQTGVQNVELIAINTDLQALNAITATTKVQIGKKLTNGQGAGAKPEKGQKSAEEDRSEIAECLNGAHMVFVAAGMGGGTGTGAAPVVAQIAKEMGILTVSVVTKPFKFEGRQRAKRAEEGIRTLENCVDSLLIIPNDRIKEAFPAEEDDIPMDEAFAIADKVLENAVLSISNTVLYAGVVNVDFADIRTVMCDAGRVHMGSGVARGKDNVVDAARIAISNPLVEQTITGAETIMICFYGMRKELTTVRVEKATDLVTEHTFEDAEIFIGLVYDENMEDEVRVTVIATRFPPSDDKLATVSSERKEERPLPESLPVVERPSMPAPVSVQPTQPLPNQPSYYGDYNRSMGQQAILEVVQQTQPQSHVVPPPMPMDESRSSATSPHAFSSQTVMDPNFSAQATPSHNLTANQSLSSTQPISATQSIPTTAGQDRKIKKSYLELPTMTPDVPTSFPIPNDIKVRTSTPSHTSTPKEQANRVDDYEAIEAIFNSSNLEKD